MDARPVANPLKAARALTERIYRLKVGGRELGNELALERYNLTPSYATTTQFSLAAALAKGPVAQKAPRTSEFLPRLLLTLVSFFTLLVALVARKQVLVYSNDILSSKEGAHDARMDTVYRALRARGTRFLEALHTIPHRRFLASLGKRRLAWYLEGFDALFSLARRLGLVNVGLVREEDIDWGSFTEEEKRLARPVVALHRARLARSEFRIRAFTLALRLSGVRAVLAIDDPRHNRELLIAAARTGIPAYEFQHGHFTKYHVGHIGFPWLSGVVPYPETLFVWSEYWEKELRALGSSIPQTAVAVGGMPREVAAPGAEAADAQMLGVLVPYETDAPKQEVRAYLEKVSAIPHAHVFFKVRPDRPREDQMREYGITESARVSVIADLASARERIQLALGTYSTYLYDLVAEGVPVGVLATSSDFGEGMVRNGLADAVAFPTLAEDIARLARTSPAVLLARFHRLLGLHPKRMEDTVAALLAARGI